MVAGVSVVKRESRTLVERNVFFLLPTSHYCTLLPPHLVLFVQSVVAVEDGGLLAAVPHRRRRPQMQYLEAAAARGEHEG